MNFKTFSQYGARCAGRRQTGRLQTPDLSWRLGWGPGGGGVVGSAATEVADLRVLKGRMREIAPLPKPVGARVA